MLCIVHRRGQIPRSESLHAHHRVDIGIADQLAAHQHGRRVADESRSRTGDTNPGRCCGGEDGPAECGQTQNAMSIEDEAELNPYGRDFFKPFQHIEALPVRGR